MQLELIKFLQENTYKKTDCDLASEAILLYVQGKSLRSCAKEVGIPFETVRYWPKTKWFQDAADMARKILQKDFDRRLTSIIFKAADNIDEKLTKGDMIVYKDGTEQRKPLTAYQEALIMAIAADKRALIRGEPTDIVDDMSTEDRMRNLKEKFQSIKRNENTLEKVTNQSTPKGATLKETEH